MEIKELLSLEFSLKPVQVENIISLLDEGCTIPFIARYRKELTGGVDDQTLRAFDDRLRYLRNLDKRKEEVTNLITEQGNMTDEIQEALNKASTLTEIEDIYRPFKPKRKTRASVAIAKGLEPLADFILKQSSESIEEKAKEFIDEEKGVNSVDEAIQGAKDIIAEKISDNAKLRKILRELLFKKGHIKAKLDESKEGHLTYEMYKDFDAEIKSTPSHRILA
ncbi:MAG: RNA-binding transcriptional accessory protein, partial [Clostridia bacterium]|nr:RNA-binding transcriptional accessory protein [Clostridia bacterium]